MTRRKRVTRLYTEDPTEAQLDERDERVRDELLNLIKYQTNLAEEKRREANELERSVRLLRQHVKEEKWYELEGALEDDDIESLSEVSPKDLLGEED